MREKLYVEIGKIDAGGFFRKINGTYIYMVMSESAVIFNKLDNDLIYGMCFNGNVAHMKREKVVEECTFEEYIIQLLGMKGYREEEVTVRAKIIKTESGDIKINRQDIREGTQTAQNTPKNAEDGVRSIITTK